MSSDPDLLDAFLDNRAEPAFRELVQRHLPMVYATAQRRLTHVPLAEDVAQRVFMLLAQKARTLRRHPSLGGWLYTTTLYTADKLQRAERRRSQREREAMMMRENDASAVEAIDPALLRPVLDDALIELKEADRTAVLLRFWEDRSYRDIGTVLGMNENAVRMRVDRALERLRVGLARRGFTSTAAALGTALTAHAVTTVPAGLAAGISVAALTAPAAGGLVFLMSTTFAKNAAIVTAVAVGAVGLFLQYREIEALRADHTRLLGELAVATKPLPAVAVASSPVSPVGVAAEIAVLRARLAEMKGARNPWQRRAEQLKEAFQRSPAQAIPEIALATEDDWLDATREKLETPDDYRRAFSQLRSKVTRRVFDAFRAALPAYRKDNNNAFPTSPLELKRYMDPVFDDPIVSRYIVIEADAFQAKTMRTNRVLTQVSVVDPVYDTEYFIGPTGSGGGMYGSGSLRELEDAYRQANGKAPNDVSQLLPLATTPRQQTAVALAIERKQIADQLNLMSSP